MADLHPIIKRALLETVVNTGQLTSQEERELNKAVRKGWLSKGKGGPWPILKTVWARPGFDFAADRAAWLDYWYEVSKIDAAKLGPAYLLRPVTSK
jgi:hypothetical protein